MDFLEFFANGAIQEGGFLCRGNWATRRGFDARAGNRHCPANFRPVYPLEYTYILRLLLYVFMMARAPRALRNFISSTDEWTSVQKKNYGEFVMNSDTVGGILGHGAPQQLPRSFKDLQFERRCSVVNKRGTLAKAHALGSFALDALKNYFPGSTGKCGENSVIESVA